MDNNTRNRRRAFGQNFLVDAPTIQKIVEDMGAGPTDIVVEIGPGKGAISKKLAENCQHLTVIEIDPKWVHYLKEMSGIKNLHVIQGDASLVKVPEIIQGLANTKGRRLLVGNLPYNRTGLILQNFFPFIHEFDECQFMVQYEVGKRMTAQLGTRSYGALSLFIQNYAEAELLQKIPPEVFRPKPNVFSAMIKFTPHKKPRNADPLFAFFIKQSFAQKRKKLINSLSPLFAKDYLVSVLKKLSISDTIRAEQLSLERFAQLYAEVSPKLQEAALSNITLSKKVLSDE